MKKKIPTPKNPSTNEDGKASKEAESIANGDLEKEAHYNAHQRKEKFKTHLSKAAIIIFWIIVSSFLMMAIIWVYHLVTPEDLHFLTTLQIDKLQTILISATAIKIGQDYMSKHI
jgi:uncharacterized membrane protein